MMNQTKNIAWGKNAKNIPMLAPSTNSALPPVGSGEKYRSGLTITSRMNGVVSSPPTSCGVFGNTYGMHAAANPARLGTATGQRGGSSHFMAQRPRGVP